MEKYPKVSARISEKLMQAVELIAEEKGVTRSELTRIALNMYCKRYIKNRKKQA